MLLWVMNKGQRREDPCWVFFKGLCYQSSLSESSKLNLAQPLNLDYGFGLKTRDDIRFFADVGACLMNAFMCPPTDLLNLSAPSG